MSYPTHGMSNKRGTVQYRTYKAWQNMRQRCDNPHTNCFNRYGAVGITYAPEWVLFEKFLEDVGLAPTIEHTIDRKDSLKGYFPENVRWATRKEQQSNIKTNCNITFNGLTHTRAEWARQIGMTREGLRARIKRVGEQEALRQGKPAKNAGAVARWGRR